MPKDPKRRSRMRPSRGYRRHRPAIRWMAAGFLVSIVLAMIVLLISVR
jgi:hypothetical protein